MPTKDIISYLLSRNRIDKLKLQLAMSCAHFLKGLKKTCIIMLFEEQAKELEYLLKRTNISLHRICIENQRDIVFLYRLENIKQHLAKQEIQQFLVQYGYDCNSLEDCFVRLQHRISHYYCERDTFPHEIGAFLDYPIEDVKGFIEHGGKNYLICGYWKVYQNPEIKKQLFDLYDRAKEVAIREILDGREIPEIAC